MRLRGIRQRVALVVAVVAAGLGLARVAQAADVESELKALRQEVETLRRGEAEKQRQLDELQRKVDKLSTALAESPVAPVAAASPKPEEAAKPDDAASALDRAVAGLGAAPASGASPDLWSRPVGGGKIRLVDVSFDTLVAGGTSTADNAELSNLEGGGHDPDRRGFTLQQAELSLMGAVDPYFNGEAHIVFTPSGVELEEAFMTTTSLPYGLQVKAGHFLSEFGLVNATHPHAWDWIDQPIINTRLFAGDGMRAPGARVAWLLPVGWFSEVTGGIQNSDEGATTTSFLAGQGIGGRPGTDRSVRAMKDMLYLARWENFVELGNDVGVKAGVSGLHGPNTTGSQAETWIYGADMKLRWRPQDNFRGWPFLIWQTEVMKRDYSADSSGATAPSAAAGNQLAISPASASLDPTASAALGADILRDYGFYSQLLYGFHYGWATGVRVEYASGSSQSVGGRENDPYRDDRFRFSPLLVWHPSEFSRLRLQYNYDDARHLDGRAAHSVWLGAEILYGTHPAHKY